MGMNMDDVRVFSQQPPGPISRVWTPVHFVPQPTLWQVAISGTSLAAEDHDLVAALGHRLAQETSGFLDSTQTKIGDDLQDLHGGQRERAGNGVSC
jgi:hypothetical protein